MKCYYYDECFSNGEYCSICDKYFCDYHKTDYYRRIKDYLKEAFI